MRDAIKTMWWALGLNVFVAIMNSWFFVSNLLDDKIQSAVTSGILVLINTGTAWFLYTRLLKQRQEDKQRVADILSGKYDRIETFLH